MHKVESSETKLIPLTDKRTHDILFRSAVCNEIFLFFFFLKYLFGVRCLEVLGLGGDDMNIHDFR